MTDRLPSEALDFLNSNPHDLRIWKGAHDYWRDLLDLESFDRLLLRAPLSPNGISLWREGAMVPAEKLPAHETERFLASRVRDLVAHDGYSLKVTDADEYHDGIAAFMRRLSRRVKRPLTANLYFSSSDSSCFKPHQDPYPVLVIQLAGRKKWWIDSKSARRPSSKTAIACAGALARDIVLESGDVLAMPALAVHHAKTIGAGPSLHLTIGFQSYKYKDLMTEIVESDRTALFFDQDLPRKEDGRFDVDAIAEALEVMSRRMLDVSSIDGFSSSMLERLVRDESFGLVDAVEQSRQLLKGSCPRKSPLPTSTPL